MRTITKAPLTLLLLLLAVCSLSALAQIPSGFVQTTATVTALANAQLSASWTNLSTSPQLPLLGGVSTFPQSASSRLDSNGHFSILLADTAQIIPTPSTWTFNFVFSCPPSSSGPGGMTLSVPITGGGGTQDISAQVTAALPAAPCGIPSTGGGPFCALTGCTFTGPVTGPSFTGDINRLISVLAPPYSAKCDGTTNDATAFSAALIAASGAGGGVVLAPPATCLLSSALSIPSNVLLAGSGQYTTTLKFSAVSQIQACIDLNGTSNSGLVSLTILGLSSPATCTTALRIRYSTNIILSDLLLSGGGYGTGANPRAQVSTYNTDNVRTSNVRMVNAGGVYGWVNGYSGLPSTRLFLDGIVDENNLAVISLSLFNCQWCRVTNAHINENNQTDSSTADGYGIMWYSTGSGGTSTQFTLSTCTGSGTLTCTVPLDGSGNTQLPVGPSFRVQTVGITGGTGTLNGTWDATLLSSTTFSVSGAGNTSGASFSSATVFYPTTNNLIDNVTIKNTAGAAIYRQGCQYCSLSHWNIENACQQESSSTLPCGCVADNAGYSLAGVAYGGVIGPGVCNLSGQNGIDFANTSDLAVSGAISLSNITATAIRDFSGSQNANFDIGGGITVNGTGKCFSTTGTGTPHNGSVSLTCSNFTAQGFFPNLGPVIFHDSVLNCSSYLVGVDDFVTADVYENVKTYGCNWTLAGTGTKVTGGGAYQTPSGSGHHSVSHFGDQHVVMNDFWVDGGVDGMFFTNNGTSQPTDIIIKNPHLINIAGDPGLWDQAPGAVTITTNSTTTVTLSTVGVLVAAGMMLGDYGTGGNNDLPLADTIASCTPLSGGSCVCPCTLTMTTTASGSHTGEAGLLQATVESGVKIWDADIQGAAINSQGVLFYGMQNLDLERTAISGFTSVGLIDFRGSTNGVTMNGGIGTGSSNVAVVNLPGGVVGSAQAVRLSNFTAAGTATNSINDNSSGTGNVYNNFTNVLGQTPSYTNSSSTVQGETTISLTPAAATVSTCTEQSFSLSGGSGQLVQSAQAITVTPPSNMGVHLWIGSARAGASNTLVVSFCADSTGGTPPAGSYKVVAK